MKYTSIFLAITLPLAAWQPVADQMLTPFAAEVSPERVWPEYPRPQMVREQWTNLNGLWDYAIEKESPTPPTSWSGKILVPLCPESPLSGVGRLVEPNENLWYRRDLPSAAKDKLSILHFEAVDYATTVFINGKEIGSHTGGHTPFSFDVTSHLTQAKNELLIRIDDDTEGYQLNGKQKLKNGGIMYTRVTGIWQTVWMEEVPKAHITQINYACDLEKNTITITPVLSQPTSVSIKVSAGEKTIAEGKSDGSSLTLSIPSPQLWTPETPFLYDVALVTDSGDKISSYTAIRSFGKAKDAAGHWRFTLNGKPYFHWGPLDQGWWPDGLLTPPTDQAMAEEIQFLKDSGFNMIRKHTKIEPRRYYYHCDRKGMLVWQDHVGNHGKGPKWAYLAENPQDANWPDKEHQQWVLEYRRMVDHLRNYPSIASWVPFNEAWGQHRSMEIGKLAKELDPTRTLNFASGGNFWPVGDVADQHKYPHPDFPLHDKRFDDYIKVVGEFGGHGFPVEGHLWKKNSANWGYGGIPKSIEEWKERYVESINRLCHLRKRGIAGGVYTQTSDVESEINGLRTYDRKNKVEPAWLLEQSKKLLATPDLVVTNVLLESAVEGGQTWRYTTSAPPEKWHTPSFDDSSWQQGEAGFGTKETPGTHVRTEWKTSDIWIRRSFDIKKIPDGEILIRIYHDEDCEVFLNGEQVSTLKGFNGSYADVPISKKALVVGKNQLSVHCRNTGGGQYIDVGLMFESPQP